MGPAIMTMLNEGKPLGKLIRLNVNRASFMAVYPDDGREFEDVTLSEVRPWPAMDAMQMLSRVSGLTISRMIQEERSHD